MSMGRLVAGVLVLPGVLFLAMFALFALLLT